MKRRCSTLVISLLLHTNTALERAAKHQEQRHVSVQDATYNSVDTNVSLRHNVPSYAVVHGSDMDRQPWKGRSGKGERGRSGKGVITNVTSGQVPCGRTLMLHPDEFECPGACPYLRREQGEVCKFTCVPATDCYNDNPLTSFANPETLRCEACFVNACHQCTTTSKYECAVCHDRFNLIDGKCLGSLRYRVNSFLSGILVLVLFLIFYMVQLYRRPAINEEALKQGMDFRFMSSLRNPATGSQYSLLKTDMVKDVVAGLGTTLHFRYLQLVIGCAIVIMLGLLALGIYFKSQFSTVTANTGGDGSFDFCNNNVRQKRDEFLHMERAYTLAVLFFYIAVTVSSIYWCRKQYSLWMEKHEDVDTIGEFALIARGFPELSGSEDVEKDFQKFLQEAPQLQGLNIVGVSVCWNYRDSKKEIDAHIEILKRENAEQASGISAPEAKEEKRTCCDPELRWVDTLLGFGNLPCMPSKKKEDLPDVVQVLNNLKTSTTVFIVFSSVADAGQALENVVEKPLDYKGSKIRLYEHELEPLTVLWDGFGCSHKEFHLRILIGWAIIAAAVIMLDVAFYMPYVQYIMAMSDVAGMTQGSFLMGTVLGLLITVCNQAIYQIILAVADSCGWTNKDKQMRFYVFQYTLAVTANTIVDLWTVIMLSRGYAVDQVMQQQAANDAMMDPQALKSPSLQSALYVQICAYIFPSCLLLPFLCEPAATGFFFLMGKWLIRSRADVTGHDAEECLACNPYDLSRYGDVLVNIMLCCVSFVFSYQDLWLIWVYFLISMVVIYTWDKIRLLRYSFRSCFASFTMERTMQYLSTLPYGIVAAVLAFRLYGTQRALKTLLEGKHRTWMNKAAHGGGEILVHVIGMLGQTGIVWACVGVFWLHILIHCALIKYCAATQKPDKSTEEADFTAADTDVFSPSHADLEKIAKKKVKTYEEVAKDFPDSFFTTNPVNCLRSKYKYKENPPCSYFQIGREFLIQPNPKLGVHYDYYSHTVDRIPSYAKRNERLPFCEAIKRFIDGEGNKLYSKNSRYSARNLL